MGRLVDAARDPFSRSRGAGQRGRGQHAQRARHGSGEVRDQVAEQVIRQDHVEPRRGLAEGVEGVVHQEMGQWNVRILLATDPTDRLAPQLPGFHDVGLIERGHVPSPGACRLERAAGDPFDLAGSILADLEGALAAGHVLDAARFAVVDAAAVLSYHQDVGAVHDIRAERRAVDQVRPGAGGAQSVVDIQFHPQPRQAVLHRDRSVDADLVPFRSADGADQDSVRLARLVQYRVGAEGAMDLPGRAAQEIFLDRDRNPEPVGRRAGYRQGRRRHLRPDMVAP
jgi:hypothetical protein